MEKSRKILEYMSNKLDLPADILAGLPKIELVGFNQLSIESHKGVLSYDKERISVQLNVGIINIQGGNLGINLMNSNYLRIFGEISTIEIQRGETHG